MFDEFRPQPKKDRPKKEPKSLKRGKPPARKKWGRPFAFGSRTKALEPSDFREDDLLAVYGPPEGWTCFQTAKNATNDEPIDKHHLMGRGGKDPDHRRTHSSIFNCAMISRSIHHGPMRDEPNQRESTRLAIVASMLPVQTRLRNFADLRDQVERMEAQPCFQPVGQIVSRHVTEVIAQSDTHRQDPGNAAKNALVA